MSRPKVLIVEDEKIVAADIQDSLQNAGYCVPALASSGEEALQQDLQHKPDLILMNIMLRGGMDGIETVHQIYQRREAPIISLTAYGDPTILERAKATEPIVFVMKPYEETSLLAAIEISLHSYLATRERAKRELRASEERYRSLDAGLEAGQPIGGAVGRRLLC